MKGFVWQLTVCKCICGKPFWSVYDFCNKCGEPVNQNEIYQQAGFTACAVDFEKKLEICK